MNYETVTWRDDRVVMLDQRRLPTQEAYVECRRPEDVAQAIRNMTIRGAPAIGVAAAMGIALGAMRLRVKGVAQFKDELDEICRMMMETRPTAANLSWAVQRMKAVVLEHEGEGFFHISFRYRTADCHLRRVYSSGIVLYSFMSMIVGYLRILREKELGNNWARSLAG